MLRDGSDINARLAITTLAEANYIAQKPRESMGISYGFTRRLLAEEGMVFIRVHVVHATMYEFGKFSGFCVIWGC